MTISFNDIAPMDLRDYFKSLGWHQLETGVAEGLIILSHPAYTRRQLIFPIDTTAPDYSEAVQLCLEKAAVLQSTSVDMLVTKLSEFNDDTIRFRVVDTRHQDDFIPLSYAVSALAGAKDLLLSAASTVLQPQIRHPRKPRSLAQDFVDNLRFRQTETGSFVLKVSAPIRSIEAMADLFGNVQTPFVRRTTLTVCKSLDKLVTAIEADQLSQLIEGTLQSSTPDLSANLCKAVTGFQEAHNDYDLYVDFAWAGVLMPPPGYKQTIKIQKDYFPRIFDVAQGLRKDTSDNEEESFLATVEHLAGDMGPDGRRSGEVILNLYPPEEEMIRARALLTADQYIEADKAHMTFGTYLKVIGKLQPGYQPRNLTISHFEVLP